MKKLWIVLLLATMVLLASGCPSDITHDDIIDPLLQGGEFIPNNGGQIGPFEPFARTDGLYGMLLVDTVERNISAFSPWTTYFEVGMSFTSPGSIGAESYTLEYALDDLIFQTYKHEGSDLVTPNAGTDTFSIAPGVNTYHYRLAINGGPYDGWHSNVVHAPYTEIDTYWASYYLDASMTNSDPPVMFPFVGNTREISMTANNLVDLSQVDFTPTYQWYRLNPATYQMTVISGATGTTYATKVDDAGYHLVVRGTGDEVDVGGFRQVLDDLGTKIPNRSYAVDVDPDGFLLVLEHAVAGISKDDFILYEDDWATPIPITALTPVEGHSGVYRIDATIPATEEEVYLECTSDFWTLTSQTTEDYPWEENLTIDME
jgi:hypothetical protein